MDAARLAPILVLILWTVPLIWPQTGKGAVSSATALIYIFLVWFGAIVLTWALSRLLSERGENPTDPDS
jgi:predicted ABC-type exoprotein transport system permease subunit